MSSTVHNLLKGTSGVVHTSSDYEVVRYQTTEPLVVGRTYTISAYVEKVERSPQNGTPKLAVYDGADWFMPGVLYGDVPGQMSLTFIYKKPFPEHTDPNHLVIYNTQPRGTGVTRMASIRNVMLVEGDTPSAWAPAEGETLAGGGALMSANLWDAAAHRPTPDADGVYLCGNSAGSLYGNGIAGASALTENQTIHMGASLRGADKGYLMPYVEYQDAAGNTNWTGFPHWTPTGQWQRFEATCVVPSGMTIAGLGLNIAGATGDIEVANPAWSYGSPVTLASSAHTPYATQDHVAAEYATKASLKVTSDAVTAEVTERGRLAGRVGTLESTTGTHTSKLEQLASSIRSLVKGESTYTDPDGKSATSGIYSLVTQTREAVTALFGAYTKTADLASTQAVRDARKAGTDAQATADAAKSAASAAQGTANGAKSTADSLATLIRADSTGVTVGKSADGKTYSTGRTRMTDSAFQVLDKAGTVITQLASDGASFLSGLVKIVVGRATLPGNLTVNSITIDSGGGVAVLRGIVSRISANLDGVTSSVSAGWEQDFGHGVTAIVRERAHLEPAKMVPERTASTHLASDKAELYVGDNSMKVTGDGFELSHPEYLRKGLHISQGSKVCTGHGTPWVTLFESWSEFKQATGCYDSGTPTLVTMNGDSGAFDGALSDCEIRGGDAVYVMAQTTSGLPNISSTQSLRINWICIW